MNLSFRCRVISVLRYPLAAGMVALPIVLVTGWLGAECPDEVPHASLCPQPPSIVLCHTIHSEATCNSTHGGDRYIGPWTCRYEAHSDSQCLHGYIQSVCWVEWDCRWNTADSKCKPDYSTAVNHVVVEKIRRPC